MNTLDNDLQALVARFEEGVSADPTANMSPEDAAKWKAMNEEHGDKFKQAGFSVTLDDAWFAFVGNAPFNIDTITAIRQISDIPFKDDGGTLHEGDVALKVLKHEYSGPLTYAQEKAGQVRENVVQVQFIKGMDKKKLLKSLQEVGKKFKLKVEPMTGYKKPQTRGKQAARIPKGDFALVQSQGMDDKVLSVHKTQAEAEAAMRKRGGEPNSLETKGLRVVNVGPKGKSEIIEVFNKLTVRPRTAAASLTALAALDLELTAGSIPGVGLDKDAASLEVMAKMAILDKAADSMIGKTILEQMGGQRRLSVMLGVQQIILLKDGVGIKWPNKTPSKGNYVEIKLNGADLYDVGFYMVGRGAKKLVKKFDDMYAEDLVSTFEKQTGWYLRMASEQAHQLVTAANSGRSREYLLDYLLNGIEHASSPKAAVASLVKWEFDPAFAQALISAWYKERPDLKRPTKPGEMAVVVQEKATTELLDRIIRQTKMHLGTVAAGNASETAEMQKMLKEHGWDPKGVKVLQKDDIGPEELKQRLKVKPGQSGALDFTHKIKRLAGENDEKEGKFEEGVSADPTENMSPEDAAEWKKQNEANKDKFKTADLGDGIMAEGCPDNLDEGECKEWEANTEKYKDVVKDQAKQAYEEGSRVPDGWDNGQINGKPKTDKPGEEGSDIPDGDGNQHKRAGESIEKMYIVVSPEGEMLGATEDLTDAKNKAYWHRVLLTDLVPGSKLIALGEVPLHLAEQFKDMGTRAQRINGGQAWLLAKKFFLGTTAKMAARTPTGLYGHTKRIQADCDGCIGRVQKAAARIAKMVYTKNEKVAEFLSVHAKRADSLPAKILVSALKGMGPKVASVTDTTEAHEDRLAALRLAQLGDTAKTLLSKLGSDPVLLATIAPQTVHFAHVMEAADGLRKAGFVTFDGVKIAKVTDADAQTGDNIKQTGDKTAGARAYGLYGYAEKVASLGLQACTDLRHEAGRHAYDLHSRRTAHHAAINDYFAQHSKKAKCMYSRLLAASYPEMSKTASDAPRTVQAWLEWEE